MEFHEILTEELQRAGMTAAEFARRMPAHPSLVSRWLSGEREMTTENVRRASVVLGSHRLRMYYDAMRDVSILPLGVLDSVDLTPAVVQLKTSEELTEAVQALQKFSLVNKRRPEDLTPEQREELIGILVQLADVVAAVQHLILAAQETLKVDPEEVAVRWSKKVRGRGYCRGNGNLVRMVSAPKARSPRRSA